MSSKYYQKMYLIYAVILKYSHVDTVTLLDIVELVFVVPEGHELANRLMYTFVCTRPTLNLRFAWMALILTNDMDGRASMVIGLGYVFTWAC